MFRNIIVTILEILMLIVEIPVILITAIIIGITYFVYIIYGYIKTEIFNK